MITEFGDLNPHQTIHRHLLRLFFKDLSVFLQTSIGMVIRVKKIVSFYETNYLKDLRNPRGRMGAD